MIYLRYLFQKYMLLLTAWAIGLLRMRCKVEQRGTKTSARIKELVLAAPDINAEIFKTMIVPQFEKLKSTRVTIYASSSDLALRTSKVVHDYRRVGETEGGVQVFTGIESVDATAAAPSKRGFGHSYILDSKKVLEDVTLMMTDGQGAAERGLPRLGATPRFYWQQK